MIYLHNNIYDLETSGNCPYCGERVIQISDDDDIKIVPCGHCIRAENLYGITNLLRIWNIEHRIDTHVWKTRAIHVEILWIENREAYDTCMESYAAGKKELETILDPRFRFESDLVLEDDENGINLGGYGIHCPFCEKQTLEVKSSDGRWKVKLVDYCVHFYGIYWEIPFPVGAATVPFFDDWNLLNNLIYKTFRIVDDATDTVYLTVWTHQTDSDGSPTSDSTRFEPTCLRRFG